MSGLPCRAVWIAFAWISAPAICFSPGAEVGWMSCRPGAVAPTITILSFRRAGSILFCRTSLNEYVGIVCAGPRKSISPPSVGRLPNRLATAVAIVSRCVSCRS